jgi:hypothetical protein
MIAIPILYDTHAKIYPKDKNALFHGHAIVRYNFDKSWVIVPGKNDNTQEMRAGLCHVEWLVFLYHTKYRPYEDQQQINGIQ